MIQFGCCMYGLTLMSHLSRCTNDRMGISYIWLINKNRIPLKYIVIVSKAYMENYKRTLYAISDKTTKIDVSKQLTRGNCLKISMVWGTGLIGCIFGVMVNWGGMEGENWRGHGWMKANNNHCRTTLCCDKGNAGMHNMLEFWMEALTPNRR